MFRIREKREHANAPEKKILSGATTGVGMIEESNGPYLEREGVV